MTLNLTLSRIKSTAKEEMRASQVSDLKLEIFRCFGLLLASERSFVLFWRPKCETGSAHPIGLQRKFDMRERERLTTKKEYYSHVKSVYVVYYQETTVFFVEGTINFTFLGKQAKTWYLSETLFPMEEPKWEILPSTQYSFDLT